jgi:DNA methylase
LKPVQEQDRIELLLQQINWDFDGALSHYGLHRMHWYPGSFIPQIPSYIIDILSNPGDTIYDPFCGVGTAMVEAVRLGRRAYGTDSNSIAVRVAVAKMTLLTEVELGSLSVDVTSSIRDRCSEYGIVNQATLFAPRREGAGPRIIADPNLPLWYHEKTWREMNTILEVAREQTGRVRNLLEVLLSSIAKRACGQSKHWGYVADNMVPKAPVYKDSISLYTRAIEDFVEAQQTFLQSPALSGRPREQLNDLVQIQKQDIQLGTGVPPESVDLIVTSPPYPFSTDCARAQRLSYSWLEESLEDEREVEVGARYKRHRQNALEDYFQELESCFEHIAVTLKPGKRLCLVMGVPRAQRDKGNVLAQVISLVKGQGMRECFARVKRRPSRNRLLNRDGETTDETIIFFEKA